MTDDLLDEAKIVTNVTESIVNRLLGYAEGRVKREWAKIKNKITGDFLSYLIHRRRLCKQVKNFIYDTSPADIADIYVETGLYNSQYIISESVFKNKILKRNTMREAREAAALIIRGPAGSGKSMLMRHLFIELSASDNGPLPIFLELRIFNRYKPTDILSLILEELNAFDGKIMRDQLVLGLQSGLFIIMLDGFDEVNTSLEHHYNNQIVDFSKKYPKCPMVISGRPVELMYGWHEFETFTVNELTKNNVISLVSKLDFDGKTKKSFISKIKKQLYYSHKEFLEIPLLCVVMLLTYSDVGKISNRRHEFYEDAFGALWSRHDARKEGFDREKYTGLDKQSFLKILSAFAASSYMAEDFSLRESSIRLHVGRAMKATGINVKLEDFLKDLRISTSLLIQDGNYFQFVHRQFQEYFTAYYIFQQNDDSASLLIQNVAKRYDRDSVLPFLLSLNDEKIERNWVLLILEEAATEINSLEGIDQYVDFIVHDGLMIDAVRSLYGLKPDNHDLQIAAIAARDMGIDFSEMFSDDGVNVFAQDKENILKMHDNLNKKYANRMIGFEEMFNNSP